MTHDEPVGERHRVHSSRQSRVEGAADLVAFARLALATLDLVAQLHPGAARNTPGFATFCTPGETGYADCRALAGGRRGGGVDAGRTEQALRPASS
jgi:2,4-dienoyl-CoA reductase-like NADH-dependent reductase (Old Yellow Enzyme family)